ncbi:MAG: hypothetical protein OIN66_14680 [Candidatus Methanoperedens sp.]|nr:hypothetical protein [Candidatus Methanoperedens sp.]
MKPISLNLEEDTIILLKEIARSEVIPYTTLIRQWVVKKVREYQPQGED